MAYHKLALKGVILDWHTLSPEEGAPIDATFVIPEGHLQKDEIAAFFNDSLKKFRDLKDNQKMKWKYAPLTNGSAKNEEREAEGKEAYPHWNGALILKAKSRYAVTLIDNLKQKTGAETFYRGCIVNAMLSVSDTEEKEIQTESGKQKMILCNRFLNGLMFAGVGEKFGGGSVEADFSAFDAVPDIGSSDDDEDLPF